MADLRVQARAIALLVALGCALVSLMSCDDSAPAGEATCARDADCPIGQRCEDRVCVDRTPCADGGLSCCLLETCRGGFCTLVPTDDCAAGCVDPDFTCIDDYCVRRTCADDGACDGGQCVAGRCVRGVPCGGLCTADQACFLHRDACRARPPSCAEQCAADEVAVVLDSDAYDGPMCGFEAAECACIGPAQTNAPVDARHADMALVGASPAFAAYDAEHGDLVFIEQAESDAPQVTWLDGLPDALPPPQVGARRSPDQPGPDRGRYARVAIGDDRAVHIAYYDADAGALRYLRRAPDGTWRAAIVVDDEGDAGRYVRLVVDAAGRPHLVYSVVETNDGRAGLRYATAPAGQPMSAMDFRIASVSVRNTGFDRPPPAGVLPRRHGVRPCLRLGPDDAVSLAFHDAETGELFLARGGLGGFEVYPLNGTMRLAPDADPGGRYLDVLEHDLGQYCDLVTGAAGVQVVFVDATTQALLSYRGPIEGGGQIEIVDPGGQGQRRRVGADPALALDAMAQPIVIYQDATDNTLRLGRRTPQGWAVPPQIVDDRGAVGYANSLIIQGREAIIGTVALGTLPGGRVESQVRVLRLMLP